jgi:hypothetical protein
VGAALCDAIQQVHRYIGIVAPIGNYKPWPPQSVSVGAHYSCAKITNGTGPQVYNDPSDGPYDYDCRAVFYLSLPRVKSVTNWNEYGVQINPSDDALWVWIDGQSPVKVYEKACGYQLLYDDNGVLPLGQIENGGSSEPCFQASGSWQWSMQQGEWMSRKTVPGLTNGEHDTADFMCFGDYSSPT